MFFFSFLFRVSWCDDRSNWSREVQPNRLGSSISATSPTTWRRLKSSTWAFRLDASPTFSSSRAKIRCVACVMFFPSPFSRCRGRLLTDHPPWDHHHYIHAPLFFLCFVFKVQPLFYSKPFVNLFCRRFWRWRMKVLQFRWSITLAAERRLSCVAATSLSSTLTMSPSRRTSPTLTLYVSLIFFRV